jgi:hypothetical protein
MTCSVHAAWMFGCLSHTPNQRTCTTQLHLQDWHSHKNGQQINACCRVSRGTVMQAAHADAELAEALSCRLHMQIPHTCTERNQLPQLIILWDLAEVIHAHCSSNQWYLHTRHPCVFKNSCLLTIFSNKTGERGVCIGVWIETQAPIACSSLSKALPTWHHCSRHQERHP